MLTLEQLKADSDWQEAFHYAEGFAIDDVAEVRNAVEGENDGDEWIVWGKLKDGRWFYLKAGCDYTGWDCQASGSSYTSQNKQDLIRMGMDRGARERFGLLTPEEKR